jgi:hypothetical protein
MPLLQYFGFVGPALLLLLLGANWLLPEPTIEPIHSTTARPAIRISSIETLPERVVFDTSLPQGVPPPAVIAVAIRPPQSAFTFAQITPGPLPAFSPLVEVAPRKSSAARRDPAKKMATHRVAPQAHVAAAKTFDVREGQLNAKPPIKTTFLDNIAGRFGQMFKVN